MPKPGRILCYFGAHRFENWEYWQDDHGSQPPDHHNCFQSFNMVCVNGAELGAIDCSTTVEKTTARVVAWLSLYKMSDLPTAWRQWKGLSVVAGTSVYRPITTRP